MDKEQVIEKLWENAGHGTRRQDIEAAYAAGVAACLEIASAHPTDDEAVRLLERSKRGHYYCEDSWYSCPKAEDGCADNSRGIDCDCGADELNAEIDAYLAKVNQRLTKRN